MIQVREYAKLLGTSLSFRAPFEIVGDVMPMQLSCIQQRDNSIVGNSKVDVTWRIDRYLWSFSTSSKVSLHEE